MPLCPLELAEYKRRPIGMLYAHTVSIMATPLQEIRNTELPQASGVRRLNHIVTEKLYQQVSELSRETRLDITDIVRLGLGLVMVAIRESQQGNKIIVANAENKIIKELILPPGL